MTAMESLPLSFAPFALFLQAGLVAKAVFLLLFAASIWGWVLIIEGAWGISRLRRAVRAGRRQPVPGLLAPVVAAGRRAAVLSIVGETAGESRTRVADCMQREAQALLARVEGGLPNLAVISSVAPFVGLFGTVWGIMISFSSIGEAKDTSLAVVGPGIAVALAATAIGLAAAIPATFGYNYLGASLARAAQQLHDLIQELAQDMTVSPDTTIVKVR
jgi:biopolymer transport protein ExbB/TolQ